MPFSQKSGSTMTRQFHKPIKLKGLVSHIWTQEFRDIDRWTVLPTGKIELIIRMGSPPEIVRAKKMSIANNPLRNFVFVSGPKPNHHPRK
jgi:hypothetical protein